VSSDWIVDENDITTVNHRMANITTKPGTWIPFGGRVVSILQLFIEDIHRATHGCKS